MYVGLFSHLGGRGGGGGHILTTRKKSLSKTQKQANMLVLLCMQHAKRRNSL